MSSIENTLNERGNRYGAFERRAAIAQGIKRAMMASPNWEHLTDSMKESLEMTAHKISRILNGDPTYIDSWHDIIGYIRLVEKELEALQSPERFFAPTRCESHSQAA